MSYEPTPTQKMGWSPLEQEQYEAMMKNTVIETMTRYVIGSSTVRVWREETEFKTGPDPEVDRILNDIMTGSGLAKRVVDALKDLPRIAAIEVLDKDKNGVVYYPDWK